MNVVGVDPGLTGGIALSHDGFILELDDMPVHDHKVDARDAHRIIQRMDPDLIVLEEVHAMPKNGSKAAFSMGDSYAVIRTIAAIEGIPLHRVLPIRWKDHFSLRGKNKDASRRLATEMFPHHADKFKRVRDDGRAEAALIAAYGFERYTNQATKESA